MIRNAITAVLALGAIGVGVLWGVSYWKQPGWQYGDRSLRDNQQRITVSFSHGKLVMRAERRGEWSDTRLTSHCGFVRDDTAPKNILFPGVRFELVQSMRVRRSDPQGQLTHPRDGENGLRINPVLAVRDNRRTPTPFADEVPRLYRVFSETSGALTEHTAPSRILILWVSLWVPLVLLGIYPSFSLMRGPVLRLRRRRKGLCVRCGYDLTGNITGVCPECGTPIRSCTDRNGSAVTGDDGQVPMSHTFDGRQQSGA